MGVLAGDARTEVLFFPAQFHILILMNGEEPARERRESIAAQLGCKAPASTYVASTILWARLQVLYPGLLVSQKGKKKNQYGHIARRITGKSL